MTRHACLAALALLVTGEFPASADAQDGSWSQFNHGTYNWGDSTNWSNGIVANGAGSRAIFNGGSSTGTINVNLEAPRTLGTVLFNTTPAGFTVGGTNPLTLSSGNSNKPDLDVFYGTATVTAPLIAPNGFDFTSDGYGGGLALTGDNTIGSIIVEHTCTLAVSRTATSNPLGNATTSLWNGALQLGFGYAGEAAQTFSNLISVVDTGTPLPNPTIAVRSAAGATLGDMIVPGYPIYVTGTTTLSVGTVTVVGNATFDTGSGMTMTIAALASSTPAYTLTKADSGTLTIAGAAVGLTPGTSFVVSAGTLNLNNTTGFGVSPIVSVNTSILNLGPAASPVFASLAGASGAVVLNGNTLTVGGDTATTYAGNIVDGTSPGILSRTGTGTLTLAGMNFYSGGTVITGGGITVAADANLGKGNVTGGPQGVLTFTGTTSTTKNFTMNGGAIVVSAGKTVTFNGSSVSGAVLVGPGGFSTNSVTGAQFVGSALTQSATLTAMSGKDTFTNFDSSGVLNIAANIPAATPVTFNGFTNESSGAITVGAGSRVNAADFQTYGLLTLNAGPDVNHFTLMTNTGASPIYFNGGSRTFIGTPQTANDPNTGQPTFVAGIDLHGQNAVVAGGLFVNNGFVGDSTNNGAGTGTIVADFGSLVKGAGFFQNPVFTQNGGKFQAGNSPGSAFFGNFVMGPGGVSNYVFAIDDATGTAGPSPDANGLVSGWGLVKAVEQSAGPVTAPGDFTWTATPGDKLTFAIDTLVNPTTVGTDIDGPMADFDPTRAYTWPAVEWTGSYAGPTDVASLDAATTFDTSSVVNPIAGNFGWSLDTASQTLSLTYTPTAVPEPGTLALSGIAVLGWVTFWRRRWRSNQATRLGGSTSDATGAA